MSSECMVDRETAFGFANGLMSAGEARRFEAHLLSCESCRVLVHGFWQEREVLLKALVAQPAPPMKIPVEQLQGMALGEGRASGVPARVSGEAGAQPGAAGPAAEALPPRQPRTVRRRVLAVRGAFRPRSARLWMGMVAATFMLSAGAAWVWASYYAERTAGGERAGVRENGAQASPAGRLREGFGSAAAKAGEGQDPPWDPGKLELSIPALALATPEEGQDDLLIGPRSGPGSEVLPPPSRAKSDREYQEEEGVEARPAGGPSKALPGPAARSPSAPGAPKAPVFAWEKEKQAPAAAEPPPAPAAAAPGNSAPVRIRGGGLELSGTYRHRQLELFLVHSRRKAAGSFISLAEGLAAGTVSVREVPNADQRFLQIHNESDSFLFVQLGERLDGGFQDRQARSSFILPPKSQEERAPAFCIEEGRSYGFSERLRAARTEALAPLRVRYFGTLTGQQEVVWQAIHEFKTQASQRLNLSYRSSSLNETLNNSAAEAAGREYVGAFRGILEKEQDAIGVVVALNGVLVEAQVFLSHGLLERYFAPLIASYGVLAALETAPAPALAAPPQAAGAGPGAKAPAKAKSPSCAEALGFLTSAPGHLIKRRLERTGQSRLELSECSQRVDLRVIYAKETVLWQVFRRIVDPPKAETRPTFRRR